MCEENAMPENVSESENWGGKPKKQICIKMSQQMLDKINARAAALRYRSQQKFCLDVLEREILKNVTDLAAVGVGLPEAQRRLLAHIAVAMRRDPQRVPLTLRVVLDAIISR